MPSKLDDLVFQVEAVLFAAGKPLSAKEISGALALEDARTVQKAVRTLEQTYENRQSALEVRRVGDRYALQLQERYVPDVHSVTPVEMAPRTLKALTLVAYHQPLLQSVLVRMIGDSAYEEVQHLRGLGLVHTDVKGSTLELSTTKRFAEYFGIASTRPEEIRRFLELLLEETSDLFRASGRDPEVLGEPLRRAEFERGPLDIGVHQAEAAEVLHLFVRRIPDHADEHALEERLVVRDEGERLQGPGRHLDRRHGVDVGDVPLLELEGVTVADAAHFERRLAVLVRLLERADRLLDGARVLEGERPRDLLGAQGFSGGEQDRFHLEDQVIEFRRHRSAPLGDDPAGVAHAREENGAHPEHLLRQVDRPLARQEQRGEEDRDQAVAARERVPQVKERERFADRVAERRLPGVGEVVLGQVAVNEHFGRGALLLAEPLAQLLDVDRAARVRLGFPEGADEFEERNRPGLGMADHLEEGRGVRGTQDGGGDVDRLGRLQEREVRVVDRSRVERVRRNGGRVARLEDLFRLEVEDAPGHVDEAAGDGEVDRAVLLDAFEERLGELDEVDLPRVELLLHDELEEERHRLLERVGDDEVDPFLEILHEGEVPLEQHRSILGLAEERTVEDEVPEDLLGRLAGDRVRRGEVGRLRLGDRHCASRAGGAGSGARAPSRLSTSWMSSRWIPSTREHPSPCIVTP